MLPLLVDHCNVVMCSPGYLVTQPALPFLPKKLGAVVFGQLQTLFFSTEQLVGNPVIGLLSTCTAKYDAADAPARHGP